MQETSNTNNMIFYGLQKGLKAIEHLSFYKETDFWGDRFIIKPKDSRIMGTL